MRVGADVGPFETFYASTIQHPILLWVAAGLGFALCATRPGLDRSL